MTNSPKTAWTKNGDGRHHANIGCYFFDYAYGGVALVRMHNEQGGEQMIIARSTKREMYNQMRAFIAGLEAK